MMTPLSSIIEIAKRTVPSQMPPYAGNVSLHLSQSWHYRTHLILHPRLRVLIGSDPSDRFNPTRDKVSTLTNRVTH